MPLGLVLRSEVGRAHETEVVVMMGWRQHL